MKVEEYKTYLSAWMSGLQSEINFWNYYFQNEGGIYFSGFDDAVSKNKVFTLEDDIPTQMYGEKYKFIDVGSGPLSRCGRITDKVQLDAVYVDPLAYAYKNIMDKCNVDNGNRLKSGFVELLSKQFEPNTFDMVHMSNSLDHSFSAVDGIYQLLNICKIGGKVILRHTENEAKMKNMKVCISGIYHYIMMKIRLLYGEMKKDMIFAKFLVNMQKYNCSPMK